MDDRHGRHRRPAADRRRRPDDGFRTSDARRFARLVGDVVATLPTRLRKELEATNLDIAEVPGDGLEPPEVPLVSSEPSATTAAPRRLVLYRRPLEARAQTKSELIELLRHVVVHELAHRLGIDDERIEELGWE